MNEQTSERTSIEIDLRADESAVIFGNGDARLLVVTNAPLSGKRCNVLWESSYCHAPHGAESEDER
jgi:hypothetical protein